MGLDAAVVVAGDQWRLDQAIGVAIPECYRGLKFLELLFPEGLNLVDKGCEERPQRMIGTLLGEIGQAIAKDDQSFLG